MVHIKMKRNVRFFSSKKIDGFFIIDLKPLFIIFIVFTLLTKIGSHIMESKLFHSVGTSFKI